MSNRFNLSQSNLDFLTEKRFSTSAFHSISTFHCYSNETCLSDAFTKSPVGAK